MSYTEYIPVAATLLIFLGVVLLVGYSVIGGKGKTDFAFGGFIGPIPFGWASSATALKVLMVVLFILAIIIFFVR